MRKETEMARRLTFALIASVLLLVADGGRAAHGTQCDPAKQGCFELDSTIAFSSNRDNLTVTPVADGGEIYLMNPDGTNVRRLTAISSSTASPTSRRKARRSSSTVTGSPARRTSRTSS